MPVTNLCYKLYAFFVLTVLIAGMSLMALISFAVYFTLGGMEFGFTIIGSLLYFLVRYMIPRQRSLDVSSMSCKECTVLTTKELAINTSLYEKNEETKTASSCSICLEHFCNGESLSTIGTCKHIFHHDCLDQWIQRSTSCPYCRRGIERRSSIKHAKKEITWRIFDELSIPIYRWCACTCVYTYTENQPCNLFFTVLLMFLFYYSFFFGVSCFLSFLKQIIILCPH